MGSSFSAFKILLELLVASTDIFFIDAFSKSVTRFFGVYSQVLLNRLHLLIQIVLLLVLLHLLFYTTTFFARPGESRFRLP